MKVKLKLGPLGQYQFTHNDEPLKDLYVLSVEPIEGVNKVMVETVFTGPIEKEQPEFHSPLETMAKPKQQRR